MKFGCRISAKGEKTDTECERRKQIHRHKCQGTRLNTREMTVNCALNEWHTINDNVYLFAQNIKSSYCTQKTQNYKF